MLTQDFIQVSPIPSNDLADILELFKQNAFKQKCTLLGFGGSANVFLFKGSNQSYAVKVFHSSSQEYLEPEILCNLQGIPCIPTLYGYIPNRLMIVKYIEGKHLNQLPISFIKPTWKRNVETSLSSIYNKGYMPFDLKEENIMVDTFGNVWFIDAGGFELKEDSFYFDMIKSTTFYLLEEAFQK